MLAHFCVEIVRCGIDRYGCSSHGAVSRELMLGNRTVVCLDTDASNVQPSTENNGHVFLMHVTLLP